MTVAAGAPARESTAPAAARAWQRQGVAAAALILVVTALQLPALLSPFSGSYHDDGIYLVTARALAEGRGYTIDSLPDALPQTKYPAAFPALLALVWKIAPSFPANLPALRLVPLLAMWLWVALLARLAREVLGGRNAARWIVLPTLASPMTLFLGTQLLSETLFAAVATAAVLLLTHIWRAAERPATLTVIAAGLTCALAFHVRTIGVAILVPALFVLLRRGGVRAASLAAVVALLGCGPWLIWQSLHAPPPDMVLAYYTKANYGDWNVLGGDLAALLRIATANAIYMVVSPLALWGLPLASWSSALALAGCLAATVAMILSLRGPTLPAALAAAATIGILLIWAWPPLRFLVPIAPFVLLAVCRITRAHPAAWRGTRALLVLLVAAGTIASLRRAVEVARSDALFSYLAAGAPRTSELLAAQEWIRRHTPTDAVVAANLDPNYALYAGRSAVRAFAADPLRLFYADASSRPLGDAASLRRLLDSHRVTHLVFEDLPGFSETAALRAQIAAARAAWPALLDEAWASSRRGVVIYTVHAAAPR